MGRRVLGVAGPCGVDVECEACRSPTHRTLGSAEGGSQGVVVLGIRWGAGCSGEVGGSDDPMVLGAVVFQSVLEWSGLVSDDLGS